MKTPRADKILLVDDEAGIRNVLGISLSDTGYDVLVADSGEAALALFEEHRPEIVLTDIKMPGMDGIELLEKIKGMAPDTEVIMITGHGDIDLAICSLKLEATDFVTKPINDEALEIALKRAHERLRMRAEIRRYTENLEQMVEEKSRKLIEAERLSAIGQTIAGLSHAIKNIASGLKGGTFVLEKGIELDNREYLQQGWQMVKGNVDKIKNLSLDLLDYAKTAHIEYRLCDPAGPAREVVDLLQGRAQQHDIRLVLNSDNRLQPVYMDPDGVHRCLMNLVTNAVDACLDENCPEREKVVTVGVAPAQNRSIQYRVSDNCTGMTPAVRANLFKQFFSTKGSGGTGIGLMLTKKIIDDLNGRIDVETEPGKGSTFILTIPEGQASDADPPPAPAEMPEQN